jgi:hypothetical protein
MATYRDPYFRLNAYDEPAVPEGLTELRTHGVNGAPPEQLLNDPHPILVSGDDTAAFYRSREHPPGRPRRTVEAYSWTGLNSRAGSRAFWLLLFPFGMANFAGWLVPDHWPDRNRRRTPLVRALIRVLGVAFTVHYGLWAMVIAVDLLAAQCGQLPDCYDRRWLGWFETAGRWLGGPAARMVAFTAVPLLLIGLLWRLGRRNARLYDRYWADTDCDPAGGRGEPGPLVDDLSLRQTDFWRAPYPVQVQALLHAAAAVAAVGATLAWTLTLVAAPGAAGTRLQWLGGLGWALAGAAVLATAATAATGGLRHRRAADGSPSPYPGWSRPARVLLAGTLGLVAAVGWLGWSLPVELTAPLPGLRNAFDGVMLAELLLLLLLCLLVDPRLAGSIVLAGILLFLALDWVQPRPLWWWWLGLAVLVAAVAVAIYRRRAAADQDGDLDPGRHLENPYWIFVGLAAVMLVTTLGWRAQGATWPQRLVIGLVPIGYLMVAFAIQVRRGHDYPPSWRLRGGGLAVIAAVGAIGLTIVSASSIVFVADRLGKAVARLPGMDVEVGASAQWIVYPGELGWIAAAALAALVVFVLALSTRVWSLWCHRWKAQVARIHQEFEDDPERLGPGRVDDGDHGMRQARSAAWARLFGGLVDDADWLVSAAVVTMLAGAVSLVVGLREADPPTKGLGEIVGFSSWALGLTVLGAIWLVRTARTDTGLRRSVGIVWEVASFFPRRFHPLAPPSYAERSVPELRGRLLELTAEGQVLLVAHSQGTLVSAAALLTLLDSAACRPRLRRIAWITYGCMLRRLFGRAYSLAVRRGDLIALKAALEQLDGPDGDAFPLPPDERPPSWMNFGRHSDYLGGRVFIDLQRPPPHPTEDRCDDVFFGDPTRRWRFRGQTQQARLWRHSFDYLDDTEDRRFAEHVARIIEDLQRRPAPPGR